MALIVSGPPWNATIPPAVPGDGISTAADFAALLALPSPVAGQRARTAAAVITGGVPYVRWVYDGALWRLDGPQDLIADFTPAAGVTGTTEQTLKVFSIPAGLLLSTRYFCVKVLLAKSGSTDTFTAQIRLGVNGNFTDTSLLSWSGLAGASRTAVLESNLLANTSTSIRSVSLGTRINSFSSATTSAAYPFDTTGLPNMGTLGVSLSIGAVMSGSTDSPTVAHVIFTGY